jgi:hypothetical protein
MEVHRIEWDPDAPFFPTIDEELEDIHRRILFLHDRRRGFGSTVAVNDWISQFNARLRLLGYFNYELWYDGTYHGNEGAYFAYDGDERM